ncbi:hypothetical protein [Reyranella sp.]|uniref:hypothetical protein n=1 Tax=Reyranella sp. TaxID=1929291 RepID=UPI003D0F1593
MTLRDTYGHFSHRPLAERIASMGGLTDFEPGIADKVDRIDGIELVRQRAARDFARQLLAELGWTLELKPPAAAAPARQATAESDGVAHE